MSGQRNNSTDRFFGHKNHLAPLPLATGEKPKDILNSIWRKNNTFLDISNYSPGSAIGLVSAMVFMFILLAIIFNDKNALWLGVAILLVPTTMLISGLCEPPPLPIRFNRQRREVCVPLKTGAHWIVPWETVSAIAVEQKTVGLGGGSSMGMLFIGFDNPDPEAPYSERALSIGIACGGGESAMAQWECVRSYMEIGPDAVADNTARFNRTKGILATYVENIKEAATRKGWFLALLWEGFCGLFVFNCLLIDLFERKKLLPLPDFTDPAIIEWSAPLPTEQWAKRSPELEAAILEREAELANGKQPRPPST
ncbi:MAG: hypothetical protein RR517_25980 [Pseudomonas sp.]